MATVVVEMDPHRRSATIALMTADEGVLDGGRIATSTDRYEAMLRWAKRYSVRM